jgi:thiamine biosynthesis lipoprotein
MDQPSTTRRQFLKAKATGEETARSADEAGAAPASEDVGGETYLVQFSRRAMACEFTIYLNAGEHEGGPEAAMRALDLIERLEDQMTVFRPHSEVSNINRRAAQGPVEVEPRLFDLLSLAVQLSAEMDGAFDITTGPLTKVWGFYRRQGAMPTAAAVAEALSVVGSRQIVLDPAERTIRFTRAGVELNLGAIGKGHALDRCAELLSEAGVENYICHGGQSSVLARGSHGSNRVSRGGWTLGIGHPLRPGKRLAEICLRDRAIGTSGSATQFFRHQGRRYGHILDPRTGWPAESVLSATVLAPTAALADALATAFYILGVERSMEFCRTRPEVAALLVTPGRSSGAIEVHTPGLTENELTLLEESGIGNRVSGIGNP